MLEESEFRADKTHELTERIDGVACAILGDNTITGSLRFFALVLAYAAVVVLSFEAMMG
jgi:hypothetical protein